MHPVGGAEKFDARPIWQENPSELENWSYLARDFVGVVHRIQKQAMKNAENQRQRVSVTHLQHEFGETNEMDQ